MKGDATFDANHVVDTRAPDRYGRNVMRCAVCVFSKLDFVDSIRMMLFGKKTLLPLFHFNGSAQKP